MGESKLFEKITLSVHDEFVYGCDVLLHPDFYKYFNSGDFIKIIQTDNNNSVRDIILKLSDVKNTQNVNYQISISHRIANLYHFNPRNTVDFKLFLDIKSIQVESVVLSFRDHYIGRADMYHIKLSLLEELVFESMKLSFGTINISVKELSNSNNSEISSGIITSDTKLVFRSRSAKMFLFLQMSEEMWEFAEDSNLYFERCVSQFIPQLFQKWKDLKTNHSVTIIFFSRIFYTKKQVQEMKNTNSLNQNLPLISMGNYYYRDFYKVIIDEETRNDWFPVIRTLKQEFISYPSLIEWEPPLINVHSSEKSSFISIGKNSRSYEGNFLEAINLALIEFSKHNIDRDLTHTGQTIMILSPSSGYFKVDKKMANLTKQKIIDNGIACDLVCVANPPLHAVPLFYYEEQDIVNDSKSSLPIPHSLPTTILSHLDNRPIYKYPYWIYICFFCPDSTIRTNTLAVNVLENVFGWQYDYNSLCNDDKMKIPVIQCRGSLSSWINDENLITTDEFNSSAKSIKITPKKSFTPALSVRPVPFDNSVDGMQQFSYDSPGSPFSSSFSENILSIGSFIGSNINIPNKKLNKTHSNISSTDIVNPFQLEQVLSKESSSSRRWSHLYPKLSERTKTERNVTAPNLYISDANWISFTEPACLPLGTYYMPTQAELNKNYLQGAYTLSLLPGEDVYQNKMEDLLQELVSQRLSQNFQLVTDYSEQNTKSSKRCVLALGHIFHSITYDKIAENITVKRFHLKDKLKDVDSTFKYHFALWPVKSKAFKYSHIDIRNTGELQVNWNSVDQLICGESSYLDDDLRLWSIHLVILPNTKVIQSTGELPLSPDKVEENKINVFTRFKNGLFKNNRLFKNEIELDITTISEFGNNIKLHSPISRSVGDIGSPILSVENNKSNKNTNEQYADLVKSMRRGDSGLQIRDRKRTITRRTFRRCIIGKELIDWILRNVELTLYKRENAIEIAQQLLNRGFLISISKSSVFEDGSNLYRFVDDQNLVNIRKASLYQKKTKPIRSDDSVIRLHKSTEIPLTDKVPSPILLQNTHKSLQCLSPNSNEIMDSFKQHETGIKNKVFLKYFSKNECNSVKVEVADRSSKTDRYQWMVFNYDKIFFPNTCFHIQIKWMICTASAIQEIIAHFEKHARQSGVTIVQVPGDREQKTRSFRAPVIINIPCEVDKHSLLIRFGFILDRKINHHYRYMHNTGVAFIRCTDDGFVWNYNYTPTLQKQMSTAVSLLQEFIDVCDDLSTSDDSDSEDESIQNLFSSQ